MGEWRVTKWGDEISLEYGKAIRGYKDIVAPYRVYGTNGPVGHTDIPLAPGPGVILGRKGAYRGVHYSPDPFFVIDTAYYVKPKSSDLNMRWLYYAITYYKLGEIDDGSPIPSTTRAAVYVRDLEVPPLHEQDAIAQLLGVLDDKIELNRRMNETLEAMARAIFKDWFVDFGPTRAKAEGRAPYLASELWDLFPNALDDDKPVGWKQGVLGNVANSPRRGVSPDDVAEDTPYIGLEHMPRRSVALTEWEGAGNVTSNKSAFRKGEFLFGKLRPYFHKVGLTPLDGICSTDIVIVSSRASDWAAFTLACLSSDEFVDYTDRTSTGTKMPRTSWTTMGQYKIWLPSDKVARAFQSLAQPLLDRLSANIHEARSLAQTRDLLLPKLMSGEIRLREAVKMVEAVA